MSKSLQRDLESVKPYLSKRYQEYQQTAMGKSDETYEMISDLIDFSLGDPDLTTEEAIIRGAFQDALQGHTHYTSFLGDETLREEIRLFHQQEYGLHYDLDEIMVTTGGCHAMWLILEAILNDGDEVILHEPYFTPYPQQVRLARGVPVSVPTLEEDGFEIDPRRLREHLTSRTRGMILNTPNNPTGACFRRETLEAVADIAREKDLIVISDEVYSAFSGGTFFPFHGLCGMRKRSLAIHSFSKNFGMTGWRLGYVLADPLFIQTLRNINENNVFTAPSVSQRAGIHALRLRKSIQPALVEHFHSRLKTLYEEVQRTPRMSMIKPAGGLYGFVNIRETGQDSQGVTKKILEEAHVRVLPGTAFGEAGEGYVRFAITAGEEKIREAFQRLRRMAIFQE